MLCRRTVVNKCSFVLGLGLLLVCRTGVAGSYPEPKQGNYSLANYKFQFGGTLPDLRIHYRTLGEPRRDANGVVRNAVLILHGTTGSGKQFLVDEFAGELFGKGALLDAEKYYLILPDDIGHGESSKPSDGLRTKFPAYGYHDMIDAEHRLVTDGLKLNHLRLVLGTSMGGMHTWMWAEQYPDLADAYLPMASVPARIGGRNRMWRRLASEAIRNDPQWQDGNYTSQPLGLRTAAEVMFLMSSNPTQRLQQAPTAEQSDKLLDNYADEAMKTKDANDVLYAVESSRDYDPGRDLEKITAPLLAINSADDLINPPELGILEREIKRVKNGTAIVIPESPETRGHGTHTRAVVWKGYLEEFLKQTEQPIQQ